MSRITTAIVVATEEITPLTRRLVLGGSEIDALRTPAGALGPYLKLHLPAGSGRKLVRTYSVRRYDTTRCELHVDVVLHRGGAGSDFALRARPGDPVAIGGPGFIPAAPCGAYLLAGDHTALPAIAHILENLPAEATVRALVEIPDRHEEQPLPSGARVEVTWLHRARGAESQLPQAVRAAWPADHADLLFWAGAEAAVARTMRAEVRAIQGIAAGRCQVLNYWKLGQPEGGFSYVE
ncbi:siderophore-interacting protein [uncultured Enterovirga sp.]|uniref:siderophore-interacting protein n=1 Tax=uncultured Enterovirga sp. TaxID=2026352 RepID=UPI0035CC839D